MRRAPSEVTKRIDSPLAPRSYTWIAEQRVRVGGCGAANPNPNPNPHPNPKPTPTPHPNPKPTPKADLDGGAARERVEDVALLVERQVHDRVGDVEERRPQELVRALALAAAVALLARLVRLPPAVGIP